MALYDLGSTTLREVGHSLTTEGAGGVAGLLGGGFLGRQIQNRVKSDADVLANPNIQNYFLAWLGNNGPKIATWYLTRGKNMGELGTDARKGLSESVVLDTVIRFFNKGTNPMSISIAGYQVLGDPAVSGASGDADKQHLIEENKALRAELSKRMKAESLPDGTGRRKRYGAMEDETLQNPRQKKYAFMQDTGISDLTKKFGML